MTGQPTADEREGLMLLGEMRAAFSKLPSQLRPLTNGVIDILDTALQRKFQDAATITELRDEVDALRLLVGDLKTELLELREMLDRAT
jgi:hypothetical protein